MKIAKEKNIWFNQNYFHQNRYWDTKPENLEYVCWLKILIYIQIDFLSSEFAILWCFTEMFLRPIVQVAGPKALPELQAVRWSSNHSVAFKEWFKSGGEGEAKLSSQGRGGDQDK